MPSGLPTTRLTGCQALHINSARLDFAGCFGGYKQSGNGREWGEAGLEEFLELKAVFGYIIREK